MKTTLKSLAKVNFACPNNLNKSVRSSKKYDLNESNEKYLEKIIENELYYKNQLQNSRFTNPKFRFQILDILGKGKFSDTYLAMQILKVLYFFKSEKVSSFLVSPKFIYK